MASFAELDRLCILIQRGGALIPDNYSTTVFFPERVEYDFSDTAEILYLVLATRESVFTRLHAMFVGYLATETSALFFEDDAESHSVAARFLAQFPRARSSAVFLPTPANSAMVFEKGAWKNLAILRHVLTAPRTLLREFSWFLMVDDDTLVIPSNLRVCVHDLADRCCGTPCYAGYEFVSGPSPSTPGMSSVVFGGSGVLMNKALLLGLTVRGVSWCEEHFVSPDYDYAGDVRLGRCLWSLSRVEVLKLRHFNAVDVMTYVGTSEQYDDFPVAFHPVTNATVVRAIRKCVADFPSSFNHIFDWREARRCAASAL